MHNSYKTSITQLFPNKKNRLKEKNRYGGLNILLSRFLQAHYNPITQNVNSAFYPDGLQRVDVIENNNKNLSTSNAVYAFHKLQLPDSLQYNTAPAKSWEEIGIILLNECQTVMMPVIDVCQFYNMGIFIAMAVWTSGNTTARNGSVFLLNHSEDNIIKLKANNGEITSRTRVTLSSF